MNSSVSVKVGGMTCFVESQFISNHDFVEVNYSQLFVSHKNVNFFFSIFSQTMV